MKKTEDGKTAHYLTQFHVPKNGNPAHFPTACTVSCSQRHCKKRKEEPRASPPSISTRHRIRVSFQPNAQPPKRPRHDAGSLDTTTPTHTTSQQPWAGKNPACRLLAARGTAPGHEVVARLQTLGSTPTRALKPHRSVWYVESLPDPSCALTRERLVAHPHQSSPLPA